MLKTLVSYPKSGRTKLRYAALLLGKSDIQWTHDGFSTKLEERSFEPRNFPDSTAFLIRKPLAILNSFYWHLREREGIRLEKDEFLYQSPYGALALAQAYTIWSEYVWRTDARVYSFEDVCRWPKTYYGVIFDQPCDWLAKETTFEAMQKAAASAKEPWLAPRSSNPQSQKVRSGNPQDFENLFNLKDIVYIEEICNASYQLLYRLRWTPRGNYKSLPPEV